MCYMWSISCYSLNLMERLARNNRRLFNCKRKAKMIAKHGVIAFINLSTWNFFIQFSFQTKKTTVQSLIQQFCICFQKIINNDKI